MNGRRFYYRGGTAAKYDERMPFIVYNKYALLNTRAHDDGPSATSGGLTGKPRPRADRLSFSKRFLSTRFAAGPTTTTMFFLLYRLVTNATPGYRPSGYSAIAPYVRSSAAGFLPPIFGRLRPPVRSAVGPLSTVQSAYGNRFNIGFGSSELLAEHRKSIPSNEKIERKIRVSRTSQNLTIRTRTTSFGKIKKTYNFTIRLSRFCCTTYGR